MRTNEKFGMIRLFLSLLAELLQYITNGSNCKDYRGERKILGFVKPKYSRNSCCENSIKT